MGVPRKVSSFLFSLAFFLFQTTLSMLTVWQADLSNESWMLPFIVLGGWIFSIGVVRFASRWFDHCNRQKGAFLFSNCLSNHGYTLLGIIAYMLYQEEGLAQATYAQFFIVPFMVFFCIPAARHYGGANSGHEGWLRILLANTLDKRNLPMVAMLTGLALNMAGIERPTLLGNLIRPFIYVGTVVSGIALGIGFRPSRLFQYKLEIAFAILYRITIYPAWFLLVCFATGQNTLDTRVLLLFGLVPSAVFSNMLADFFDLDGGMTNAVYAFSTAFFLILVLPLFILLSPYIQMGQ
jgi:hypothetical protein